MHKADNETGSGYPDVLQLPSFTSRRDEVEKQFIREMLGTNHSQTEIIHAIIGIAGAYGSARGIITTGRVTFGDKLDFVSMSGSGWQFGPPFNINPGELTSTPLLALAVWAVQDAFIRARNAFRGFGSSSGTSAGDEITGGTFSGLSAESGSLQPAEANDYFTRLDGRLETLRRSLDGTRNREPRFFRDDAYDRMMHDRAHGPRGDFGASDTTRRTA